MNNRSSRVARFVLSAAVITALVGGLGSLVVPPATRPAVWLGAGVAFGVQLVLFVSLFVVAFSSRPMLAHGLGMLGRFLAFVAIALVLMPRVELPAAPLFFSLVAVFFLTTLLEPLFLFSHSPVR